MKGVSEFIFCEY